MTPPRHAPLRRPHGACDPRGCAPGARAASRRRAARPFAPAARRLGLRALGAFASLVLTARPAGAQPRTPANAGDGPNGVWTSLEARIPLAEKGELVPTYLRWITEARFGTPAEGASYLLARGGPLWEISPNLLVAVNATQNVEAVAPGSFVPETRVEIEPTLRAAVGALAINQRLRFEHRWFPDERRVRFRLQERVTYHPEGWPLAPFVSSEAHFDLSGEGFNEWRNVAGISLKAGETLRADVGYMARFDAEAGDSPRQNLAWELNHVLSLGLVFTPKLDPLVDLDAL